MQTLACDLIAGRAVLVRAGKVTVSNLTWSQCQAEALSRPCVCKQVLLQGVLLKGKMKNLWQG